jgi:Ni,Fe-hydrogenase III large subunit
MPFGPQHPVLPEPIQLRLVLEDERVVEALPALGYCHRGIEKLAEQKDFLQNVYLIERICGICSFMHSMTYCQGIEAIMGLAVPDRARYLRVVWAELHRMHSHLLILGLTADAFGFENLFMQLWRAREGILDIMEKTAGGRIMLGTCCIGGVRRDIAPEAAAAVLQTLDEVDRQLGEALPPLGDNYTVRQRTIGVGRLPANKAHELGAVGPVARASGLKTDFRETGYAAYGELGFQPAVETGGDCHARIKVRVRELAESSRLIRQALQRAPGGPLTVPVKGNPSGDVASRMEQPRGELIYYIKGNGTKNLERFRARMPTFANLAPLLHMLNGCQLADVPVIILSIDPCISCTER